MYARVGSSKFAPNKNSPQSRNERVSLPYCISQRDPHFTGRYKREGGAKCPDESPQNPEDVLSPMSVTIVFPAVSCAVQWVPHEVTHEEQRANQRTQRKEERDPVWPKRDR